MFKNYTAKRLSLILAVAVIPTLFTSCSKDISKDKQNLLDEYTDLGNQTDYSSSSIYADIGSGWLSPETEYICYGTDDSNGIDISNSGFMQVGDRLYYPTRIYYKNSINYEESYSYLSLTTGQYSSLCPDPMCDHLDESGCKYMNLESIISSNESDDILYAAKSNDMEGTISICRIDAQNDIIEVIHTEKTIFLHFSFISEGKLYFRTISNEKIMNENNEVINQTVETRKVLDLNTKKVETIENEVEKTLLNNYIYSDGTYIYFRDSSQHRLYVTDMNYENEQTIFEYDNDHVISFFNYDTTTEELYFCCSSSNLLLSAVALGESDAEIDGRIYKVNKNLECEPLVMASDQILDYRITNNYIYYTVFDPIVYGMSPRGYNSCMENGNKIYRAKRSDLTSAELVFDGRDELFFSDYYPADGHLYLNYLQFVNEGGMNWFRVMDITARIDIEKNTIKWLAIN